MKNHSLPLLLSFVLFLSCAGTPQPSGLAYVDPMIGTEGDGTEYGGLMPYVGVPFGSAQWVPMTRLTGVGITSYNDRDSMLLGFIASRQPAIWMGEWGQLSFQPQLGEPATDYATRGRHIDEEAYTPYGGRVVAGGIETTYAALEHSAVFRFSQADHLVIDASRKLDDFWWYVKDPQPGHIDFADDHLSASGWNCDRFDAIYTTPKPNFRGYFYMEFSRPFDTCSVPSAEADEVQTFVTFAPSTKPLTVRIGLSLISVEQAKENLRREVAGKSPAAVSRLAKAQWEQKMNTIEIDADDDVKTIFYTGLFHSLLYPRQIDEYGRYYSAFDDQVHEGHMYNCWSMWDTYRAEHPLLTLVAPERVDDMMQSLVEMYHEGGWLPKWPNPSYTGIMTGSPAETILAEAAVKGFKGFDWDEAYAAVKKNATVPQPIDHEFRYHDRGVFGSHPETRAGLSRYMEIGYVTCSETHESVSRTQDFGLQDLAAAQLAELTGHPDDAAYFRARSKNYRNLWNDEEKLFLPRELDGKWVLNPGSWDYTECTPQTALWAVPYDVDGLVELIGSREEFEHRLDLYFDSIFWNHDGTSRTFHGNEPSHHLSYLYNRIGRPAKTQSAVRQILARSYGTDSHGLDGNDDCGQMSAWYILSSLGLYMLNPADGWYELGAPCVREATLHIGAPYTPATLHIVVRNLSPECTTIRSITWNGQPVTDYRIHHNTLIQGGELVFEYEPLR